MKKYFNIFLISMGVICSVLYAMITWLSFGLPASVCRVLDNITLNFFSETILELQNGFYYANLNDDMPTAFYLSIFAIIFALVFYVFKSLTKARCDKTSLLIVIGFSIIFRLVVFWGEPIHENDIYRYLWDGKVAVNGINPFKYAPADVFMYDNAIEYDYYDISHDVTLAYKDFTAEDKGELKRLVELRDANLELYGRIGHWQVPTIYPPVAQFVFMLSTLITPDSLVFMRFLFMLFDIGVILVIVALLKHFNLNPLFVLLYGWMPLVPMQLVASGHYDAVVVFFVILSLLLYCKGRMTSACCVLTLAVLTKFFPLVLLPFMFRKTLLRSGLIFVSIASALYVPYFYWNGVGVRGVFEGLMTYNTLWSYHASIFDAVYYLMEGVNVRWVESLVPAKMVVATLYGAFLAVLYFNKNNEPIDIVHKSFWAIAGLFIINPVCDPWYYCWVMPFLCVFHYRSWIFLSALLMLSYLNFHTDLPWVTERFLNIKLIVWLTYVPFYVLLGCEIFSRRGRVPSRP